MYPQAAPSAGKSSAKLFIGIAAAAALMAIVGISVVLMSGGKSQSTASPAPVAQPAQSSTPQPAASAGAGQPSIPSQPPPPQLESPKPVGGGLDGSAAFATGESSSAGKAVKTVRRESDADAAARKEKARKAAEARRLLNQ